MYGFRSRHLLAWLGSTDDSPDDSPDGSTDDSCGQGRMIGPVTHTTAQPADAERKSKFLRVNMPGSVETRQMSKRSAAEPCDDDVEAAVDMSGKVICRCDLASDLSLAPRF